MTVTPHGLNDENRVSRSPAPPASSVSVAETGAIFSSAPAGTDSIVVTVHGDIDMRSAPILADYVCAHVVVGMRLVLDLSDVGFFGIAGLTVFTDLDGAVAANGATWCLIEGHPVHRLLEAAAAVPSVQRFGSVAEAFI